MVNYVTEELNRIYRLFKKHNPNFEGKVSLYGHSLGSLLAFDILCHQPKRRDKVQVTGLEQQPGKKKPAEVDLSDLMHGASSAEERRGKRFLDRPDIKYQVLEFEVDRLFVVGSPVGLFMLLKGDKMRARLLEMAKEEGEMVVDEDGLLRPEVNAIYNIFHPHDPVAYRIEPIIKKEHAELKPVQIPYTKGGLKGTVLGITDLGNDLVDRSRWVFESVWARTADVVSSAGKVASIVSAFRAPVATAAAGAENKPATDSEAPPVTTEDSIPGTSQKLSNDKELTRLNPRGRIDYALQEGVLENPYLSALGVHMAYWPDQDCAMFILSELYRQSKEEASEDAQTPGSGTASGKGGSLDMPGGKGKAEEKAGGNLARTPSLNKPALPPRTKPAASPADATPLSSTPPRSGFASLLSGLGLGTATTAPTPEIVPAGAVAIPKTKTVPGETELQDLGSLARSPGDLSKSTSEIMSELDHLSYL
ncbi:hypothetical protein HK097_004378 [Rhizophlyctis rosea]|uniref:DDHD domain-containing protein n=1 Tax=Rhizophlyctis rosea TaxID=64517 RepID=A0AAD5SE76_9FUNG|nr:hypothetical protein HK097_004378 [Rhizophlyctis rosea]